MVGLFQWATGEAIGLLQTTRLQCPGPNSTALTNANHISASRLRSKTERLRDSDVLGLPRAYDNFDALLTDEQVQVVHLAPDSGARATRGDGGFVVILRESE